MTNIKERTLIKELMWNTMFEIVFYDMKEVTIAIINDCCRTNYNVNKDAIKDFKRQIPRNNKREKALICDYVIMVNEKDIYNIEINRSLRKGLRNRDWNYILKLHTSRISKGDTYKKIESYKAKQLNFNNYRNRSNTPIEREGWVNLSTNERLYENIEIIQFV